MATGYLLQDYPNPNFGQFGWPRKKVSGVIGVHTTESGVDFDGPDGGAENTAAFIRRRTDPGGYHSLADADSRIKLVHPRYAAWADTTNNAHAMSVSAAMNAARWRDLAPARAAAIVRNLAVAAAELVRDAIAAGLLDAPVPARRITAAEAIAGSRAGFYGHGETNPGRRYDPGTNFDWPLFLQTYENTINEGDGDMPSAKEVADEVLNRRIDRAGGIGGTLSLAEMVAWYDPNLLAAPGNFWAYTNATIGDDRDAYQVLRDGASASLAAEVAGLKELVSQLAVKQGVVIDYDQVAEKVAKAVNDDAAARMKD